MTAASQKLSQALPASEGLEELDRIHQELIDARQKCAEARETLQAHRILHGW